MTDNQEYWITANTRYNQELSLRDQFIKRGITHFIPTRTVPQENKDQRKEIEQPVIANLIFLKVNWEEAFRLLNLFQTKMSYIRQKDKKILTIPNRQMEDFIRLITEVPDKVTIIPDCYTVGDRVMIKNGTLAGIEGILVESSGKREFVVRIASLLSASIRIPKSNLVKLKES